MTERIEKKNEKDFHNNTVTQNKVSTDIEAFLTN